MRFNSERPIFAQISELLAARILEGELGPGARLPSARELASSLEVNPNTAARALQALADEGVARCERGTGYFVSETGPSVAKAERRKSFFEAELPALFRRMDELGIGIEEIAGRYASRGSPKESDR
jgi:GntR family transcriptional regulator